MELKSEFQRSSVKRKLEEHEQKFHKEGKVTQFLQKPQQSNQIGPLKKSCNVIMPPASVCRRITEADKVKQKTAYLKKRYGTLVSSKDQYEILQFLGEGAFGEVTKCFKKGTNENVAVKICKSTSISSRYFNNECAVLRILNENNPDKFHFVRSLDFFTHQNKFCLAFEMLEQNLHDYIKNNGRKPVSLDGIRSISEQVLTSLSKLKALNIIHSDIKPENIMLMDHKKQPFQIKIIDFGVAIRLPTERYPAKLQTLHYRSPEVLLGLPYSASVDMWSFGCVLAEMLLGRVLYPGKCDYDQMRYICATQELPPKEMLDLNSVAMDYFYLEKTNSKNIFTMYKWQLMSLEEYRKRRDLPEAREICDSGLKTLDDIVEMNGRCGGTNRPRTAEEIICVSQCVDLLKKTLAIKPEDRISPEDALKHIFMQPVVLTTESSLNDRKPSSAEAISSCCRNDQSDSVTSKGDKTCPVTSLSPISKGDKACPSASIMSVSKDDKTCPATSPTTLSKNSATSPKKENNGCAELSTTCTQPIGIDASFRPIPELLANDPRNITNKPKRVRRKAEVVACTRVTRSRVSSKTITELPSAVSQVTSSQRPKRTRRRI